MKPEVVDQVAQGRVDRQDALDKGLVDRNGGLQAIASGGTARGIEKYAETTWPEPSLSPQEQLIERPVACDRCVAVPAWGSSTIELALEACAASKAEQFDAVGTIRCRPTRTGSCSAPQGVAVSQRVAAYRRTSPVGDGYRVSVDGRDHFAACIDDVLA